MKYRSLAILVAAFFVANTSHAADLKQLAEQLVNLTVKEMPTLAPQKDALSQAIAAALEKDPALREAVERFMQTNTLEPQARAQLMQIIAQLQTQAVGAAPAKRAVRAGNGQDLSWADFDEFGKKAKDSADRDGQENMWDNAKAVSDDGRTVVGAGYKESMRTGRNPQTGKEIKIKAGIAIKEEGAPPTKKDFEKPAQRLGRGSSLGNATGEEMEIDDMVAHTEKLKERIKERLKEKAAPLAELGDAPLALFANKLARGAWELEDVEVQTGDDAPRIKVKAKRVIQKKLFGFIPVTLQERVEIEEETERIQRPWWSIFAW